MTTKAVDFEGREFKVGDIFVSAQRASSSLWLAKYQVLEIIHKPSYYDKDAVGLRAKKLSSRWKGDLSEGKEVVITALERCIITNSANRT